MTTKHRTKGFVFKKSNRSEADRIYSVFTKDYGRLEIFGKAIRKITSKLKGGIDVFCLSEIEFIQGKSNRTLTGATKIKNFDGIIENSEKIKIAYQISDVLDNFLKGQEKDEKILDLTREVFSKLNDDTLLPKTFDLIYYYFVWNFLYLLGYGSEVNVCASCHKGLDQNGIYFSIKEGGTVCRHCIEKDRLAKEINSDVVKVLRVISEKKLDILSRLKIEDASKQLLESVSESAITAFCPS
jgi:DNA repair protein RecO (recombination protein O)